MQIGQVGRQNVVSTARIRNFGNGKGTGNGHHGVCSGWYGYCFNVNYMIGLVGVDSDL